MSKTNDSCLPASDAVIALPPCAHRQDYIQNLSKILEMERKKRSDEIAIDLEDRNTKKGTPPAPCEAGDIRDLRRQNANNGAPTPNRAARAGPVSMVE